VRAALVDAGLELARDGGPDAVVLREVTRRVGVVPNTAYRHFADRAALLAAVREAALGQLAQRMAEAMARVRARTPARRALLRMGALGRTYLDFARTEPGLFEMAFAATDHLAPTAGGAGEPRPLDYVNAALDGLVDAGLLAPERRPNLQYPIWATVHGVAVLLRGPLRTLSDRDKSQLEAQTLAFIEASLT
jgi:AcrR family transcriptional regulator